MHSSDTEKRADAYMSGPSLRLVHVVCSLCGADDPRPVAVGEDFELGHSDETFLMVGCRACGLLYLNPRPVGVEAERGAPAGVVARMRRRSEAAWLARLCRRLPARARVLDVGCGDGFLLAFMREFAPSGVSFEGVEIDPEAVAAARARGLSVHEGTLGAVALEDSSYDLVLGLRTLERSGDPGALLGTIRQLLRPGGTLVLEEGNAGSPGRRIFRDRYWSGYRFPRAWNVFTRATLSRLAASRGLRVRSVATRVSPLGWTGSIRNALVDVRAPNWLVERFGRPAPALLAFFTLVDALGGVAGGASLLLVTLQRPAL